MVLISAIKQLVLLIYHVVVTFLATKGGGVDFASPVKGTVRQAGCHGASTDKLSHPYRQLMNNGTYC